MAISDNDRLVCATLAAAKAVSEKKELPLHFIIEYEKMVRVFERRQVPGPAAPAAEKPAAASAAPEPSAAKPRKAAAKGKGAA